MNAKYNLQISNMSLLTFFFLVLVLLTAQCCQKLNASSLSLTCSRLDIWLHDIILQKVVRKLSDPSRVSTRGIPPREMLLLFTFPDFILGVLILEFHHLPIEMGGVHKRWLHYLQAHTFSHNFVGPKPKNIYFICCSLFAHLSTPCPLWAGIKRR